ncbi:9291_t:CDS:2 [Funneliformis geosporum]|uniref:10611_t:CDS:1 n=1 Tax=Funneliformis geosporum TaxID=1117311 RepID=A0A9W4WXD3_9GLOM|nr:10611_t:CDS:2 [Funneliformis geosporum]CAI2193664.1 9291_t:CDS:2 [Funneliformis geosporum]
MVGSRNLPSHGAVSFLDGSETLQGKAKDGRRTSVSGSIHETFGDVETGFDVSNRDLVDILSELNYY